MWVTQRPGGQLYGFATRWSWSAAFPGVALQWGALAGAIAAGAIAPFAAIPVIAGAAVLGVAAYRKSHPRDKREEKRRDLTASVLRTGCPVALLPAPVARAMA